MLIPDVKSDDSVVNMYNFQFDSHQVVYSKLDNEHLYDDSEEQLNTKF